MGPLIDDVATSGWIDDRQTVLGSSILHWKNLIRTAIVYFANTMRLFIYSSKNRAKKSYSDTILHERYG